MTNELISVIIPVYNTAEYLPRCLDSVLNNTYPNLEIICVNDGSRDNSLEVLKAYAEKDSRVKVIDQENAGVSAARNHGLDVASGEYIAFVDSDDWVHRQYFDVLLTTALNQKAHIAICGYTMIEDFIDDAVLVEDQLSAVSLSYDYVATLDNPSWGRLFHRSALGSLRFDTGITLAEDTVFALEILRINRDLRIVQLNAPMYYYFTRQDSLVHTLSHLKLVPLLNYYFDSIGVYGDSGVEASCLLRACKTLYRWRYYTMFQRPPVENTVLRQFLVRAKAELRRSRNISFKTKLSYLAMIRFPIIYRLARILNDPTMLKWEKLQRKKARAEKNKK